MAGDAEKIKLLYGSHPPLSLGNHVITLHKNQLRTPVSEKKIKKNKIQSLPLEEIITFEQKPTMKTKHTTKQSQQLWILR